MSVEEKLNTVRGTLRTVAEALKVITVELCVYQFHLKGDHKMYREVLTPAEWTRFCNLDGMVGKVVVVTLSQTTREMDVRSHAQAATRIIHCPFSAGSYGREVWIRHWYTTHAGSVVGVGLDEGVAMWRIIGFLKLKPSQRLVIRELLAYHWAADYATVEQRMDHLLEKLGEM
jgi:hypothetical protein